MSGRCSFPFLADGFPEIAAEMFSVSLSGDPDQEPVKLAEEFGDWWLFKGETYSAGGGSDEEISLHIKHAHIKARKELEHIRRTVEAFENFEHNPVKRREPIPESVRLFVWQRDKGQCVRCGSNLRLEFDHIIPFADGGSDTERNIQLLCETCNRQKGKSV